MIRAYVVQGCDCGTVLACDRVCSDTASGRAAAVRVVVSPVGPVVQAAALFGRRLFLELAPFGLAGVSGRGAVAAGRVVVEPGGATAWRTARRWRRDVLAPIQRHVAA